MTTLLWMREAFYRTGGALCLIGAMALSAPAWAQADDASDDAGSQASESAGEQAADQQEGQERSEAAQPESAAQPGSADQSESAAQRESAQESQRQRGADAQRRQSTQPESAQPRRLQQDPAERMQPQDRRTSGFRGLNQQDDDSATARQRQDQQRQQDASERLRSQRTDDDSDLRQRRRSDDFGESRQRQQDARERFESQRFDDDRDFGQRRQGERFDQRQDRFDRDQFSQDRFDRDQSDRDQFDREQRFGESRQRFDQREERFGDRTRDDFRRDDRDMRDRFTRDREERFWEDDRDFRDRDRDQFAEDRSRRDIVQIRERLGADFSTQDDRLVVSRLASESLASRWGLRRGDVILSVAGNRVAQPTQFYRYLMVEDARRLPVVVWREGQRRTIYIEPQTLMVQRGYRSTDRSFDRGEAWLGVELDSRYSDYAVIERVYPNSPAEQAGLRRGDWLEEINGRPVNSYRDVYRIMDQMEPGQRIDVTFSRRSNRSTDVRLDEQPRRTRGGQSYERYD